MERRAEKFRREASSILFTRSPEERNLAVIVLAALYVESESFNSDISIKEVKEQGKKIQIVILNAGKKHQVLSNLSLLFTDDRSNKKIIFKAFMI